MEATIILLSGDPVDLNTWQKMYYLTPGSSQIGRFFDIGEKSFKNGLTISEGVIRLLDMIRILWNRPININSLDRTKEDQERLKKQGYRTAKFSPHIAKMACDIDTVSKEETLELKEVIEEAADLLGYHIRIGWQDYMNIGQTFIHIDVCPMYYRTGKPLNKENHPWQWEIIDSEW